MFCCNQGRVNLERPETYWEGAESPVDPVTAPAEGPTTMATTTTTMATPPLGTDIGSDEEASLIEYVEGLEEGRVPDYRFLKSWGVQRLKLPPRMLRQGIDWQAFWLDDETIDEYWRLLVERHDMIRNLASSQQPAAATQMRLPRVQHRNLPEADHPPS